uniref:Uncharacterized protein n=1 Tax=Romanomermis culicivorax TaxID=13658 RepID=A0A915JRM1_ROMCU
MSVNSSPTPWECLLKSAREKMIEQENDTINLIVYMQISKVVLLFSYNNMSSCPPPSIALQQKQITIFMKMDQLAREVDFA